MPNILNSSKDDIKTKLSFNEDDDRIGFEDELSSMEKFSIDDALFLTGGSWGRFQKMSSLCFFVLFGVGSQFFYSIPFY